MKSLRLQPWHKHILLAACIAFVLLATPAVSEVQAEHASRDTTTATAPDGVFRATSMVEGAAGNEEPDEMRFQRDRKGVFGALKNVAGKIGKGLKTGLKVLGGVALAAGAFMIIRSLFKKRKMDKNFWKKDMPDYCPSRCNERGLCLIDYDELETRGEVEEYLYKCHCHPLWTGKACQTKVDQFLRWFEAQGKAKFPKCCNVCPSQFENPVDYKSLPVYQNPYSSSDCNPELDIDSRPGVNRPPCWRPLSFQPDYNDPLAKQTMTQAAAMAMAPDLKEPLGEGQEEAGFLELQARARVTASSQASAAAHTRFINMIKGALGMGGGEDEINEGTLKMIDKLMDFEERAYKKRMKYPIKECCIFCDFDYWTQANAVPHKDKPNTGGVNYMLSIERQRIKERMASKAIMREMRRREVIREQDERGFQINPFHDDKRGSFIQTEDVLLTPEDHVLEGDDTDFMSHFQDDDAFLQVAEEAQSRVEHMQSTRAKRPLPVFSEREQRRVRIGETKKEKKARIRSRDAARAEERAARLNIRQRRTMSDRRMGSKKKGKKRKYPKAGRSVRDYMYAGPESCCSVCPVPASEPEYFNKYHPHGNFRMGNKHKGDQVANSEKYHYVIPSKKEIKRRKKKLKKMKKIKEEKIAGFQQFVYQRMRQGKRASACCDYCPSQFWIRTVSLHAGPFDGDEPNLAVVRELSEMKAGADGADEEINEKLKHAAAGAGMDGPPPGEEGAEEAGAEPGAEGGAPGGMMAKVQGMIPGGAAGAAGALGGL